MFSQLDVLKLIKEDSFRHFLKEKLNSDELINIYIYGSVVYGCKDQYTDLDLIIVTKETTKQILNLEYQNFEIDCNFISLSEFEIKLANQEISIIECVLLDQDFKNENKNFVYKLDLKLLRSSISEKASNSFVKAKKKFIDGEYYIGKKSLWHSLRILQYGIDIAKNEQIEYQSMNHLFSDIVLNESNNYEDYIVYKKKYNELSSEFKKVAPK